MSYEKYSVTPEELEKIKEVNKGHNEKKCSCAIYEERPTHCRQYPLRGRVMPDCGYWFEGNDRKGKCKRCARCCGVLRKDGNPYGFFDIEGSKCRNLKVEE